MLALVSLIIIDPPRFVGNIYLDFFISLIINLVFLVFLFFLLSLFFFLFLALIVAVVDHRNLLLSLVQIRLVLSEILF